MKLADTKWKKSLWIVSGILITLFILIIIFISPIAKYLIEKYDVKYTGREIKIDWLYLNPFTGYVHMNDLKIYEQKSDSIFFQSEGLSADFSMLKLVKNTYEISTITLNKPRVNILRLDSLFNFTDLILRYTPKVVDTLKAPVHFNILDIEVKDATICFIDTSIPVYYYVKNVDITSTGKFWNIDSIEAKLSLKAGVGTGDLSAKFNYHFSTTAYRFSADLKKFDFNLFEQYMKEFMNYGSMKGNLDAHLSGSGDLRDKENIDIRGRLAINDFHFGQQINDDIVSFKKLSIDLERVAPKGRIYFIDSVKLDKIFLKYERYDYLDNFQRIFGKSGSNVTEVNNSGNFNLVIEIAKYIKEMVRHFFSSYYKLNRLDIVDGKILYNDFAIDELFAVQLNAFNVYVDSIDKYRKNVNLTASSAIHPYGNLAIKLSMNPQNYEDFVLDYHLQKISIAMANPYLVTYTSFPFNRGTIELKGNWNVKTGQIQSQNHILLLDPRVARRVKNNKWIPMQFIMALVRENGNIIDYSVPITGDLKDPKFHLREVVKDVLKNIFVKPITTPYRFVVKHTENELEKTLTSVWQIRSANLSYSQENYLQKVAHFLHQHPEVMLSVTPNEFEMKEKEAILFYEAKKKYLTHKMNWDSGMLSSSDSMMVLRLRIKDSNFVHYMEKSCQGIFMYTIQEKCACFVGEKAVNLIYQKLQSSRKNSFMQAFKDNGTMKQINFYATQNKIPYNGFSFYQLKYNSAMPVELIEAYEKMDVLDEKNPRKSYRNHRLKIDMLPTKIHVKSKEELIETKHDASSNSLKKN